MYAKVGLLVLVATFAALFSAQPVDAAKGPKITHKVYFDIKHGDASMGRSEWSFEFLPAHIGSLKFEC
jgi:peptidyl-prolyl cis-trans isomerase B (cyclophilin B)